MNVKFNKYEAIASGEVFYALPEPMERTIDNEKFIECTQDFKTAHYVRFSSLRKVDTIVKHLR